MPVPVAPVAPRMTLGTHVAPDISSGIPFDWLNVFAPAGQCGSTCHAAILAADAAFAETEAFYALYENAFVGYIHRLGLIGADLAALLSAIRATILEVTPLTAQATPSVVSVRTARLFRRVSHEIQGAPLGIECLIHGLLNNAQLISAGGLKELASACISELDTSIQVSSTFRARCLTILQSMEPRQRLRAVLATLENLDALLVLAAERAPPDLQSRLDAIEDILMAAVSEMSASAAQTGAKVSPWIAGSRARFSKQAREKFKRRPTDDLGSCEDEAAFFKRVWLKDLECGHVTLTAIRDYDRQLVSWLEKNKTPSGELWIKALWPKYEQRNRKFADPEERRRERQRQYMRSRREAARQPPKDLS